MARKEEEDFYYHAAAYKDFDISGEVYHALDEAIHATDYNLSVYRIQEPESKFYVIIVIGERPSKTFDHTISEHLMGTGELVELSGDVLRALLARRPDMNWACHRRGSTSGGRGL